MWPAFVLATIVEGVLWTRLPASGDGPDDGLVPGLLLAAAFNLIVVAAVAPAAGELWRRRRRDLPRPIATDQAGTVALGFLVVVYVVAGVVNHATLVRRDRDAGAAYAATATYVHRQARPFLARLSAMDAVRVEDGMYRTCVPEADPERALCLFVNVDQSPPGITRDPERLPNALWRR